MVIFTKKQTFFSHFLLPLFCSLGWNRTLEHEMTGQGFNHCATAFADWPSETSENAIFIKLKSFRLFIVTSEENFITINYLHLLFRAICLLWPLCIIYTHINTHTHIHTYTHTHIHTYTHTHIHTNTHTHIHTCKIFVAKNEVVWLLRPP